MAASSSSSSPKYDVFISHAEEDKATIAIPLRETLCSLEKTAFVDEQDIAPGAIANHTIVKAMEHAKVAVIILSPEFVARKQTMCELLYFLSRQHEHIKPSTPSPIIIPVFYRLSIEDTRNEPCLSRLDTHGKSIYHASHFFERRDNREPEAHIPTIKQALESLRKIMGVKNVVKATNDSSYRMSVLRTWFIENISAAVLENLKDNVVAREPSIGSAQERDDSFRPHFHVEYDIRHLVFDFENRATNSVAGTVESRLLEAVVATAGGCDISVQGIAGVGKTSMILALSSLDRVKQHFEDGIYLFSLGRDADLPRLKKQMCSAVESSGDEEAARKMKQEEDWKEVMRLFRSRFEQRQCLFLIDDICEGGEISAAVVQELRTLHSTGMGSKVIFTTRSRTIASEADKCFLLKPKDPLSAGSRDILTRYAGITPHESNLEDNEAVNCILEACSGLPLFLAIAGKTVKVDNFRRGSEGCIAYHVYASRLHENMQSLLSTDLSSHERLRATLSLSVEMLQERMNRNIFEFRVDLTAEEMYRRLCVLQKLVPVPMQMLRNLWELENMTQAANVAWEFEQMGLVDIEIHGSAEMLHLHDSLLLFAVNEARRHGTEVEIHDTLLKRYGLTDSKLWSVEEQRTMWWSNRLERDGYIHANLCRHLKEADRLPELVELLLVPEWIARQLEVSDILRIDADFALGINAMLGMVEGCLPVYRRTLKILLETLKLIRQALKLSSWFISRNPRELWFQLYARLIVSKDSCIMIPRFLDRMEKRAQEPWLRAINWFVADPLHFRSRIIPVGAPVSKLLLFKDKNWAACGFTDGRIVVLNLTRATVEREWHGHEGTILALAGGKEGDVIVTGSADRSAKAWNVRTGKCLCDYRGHASAVNCVGLLDDDRRVVSASRDGAVHIWDLDTGQVLVELRNTSENREREVAKFRDGTRAVLGESTYHAISADGTHIVSGENSTIGVWKLPSGLAVAGGFFPSGCIHDVAVTRDGKRVWVADIVHEAILIWNIESDERIIIPRQTPLVERHDYPRCISVSDDGNRFASGSEAGPIRVWDASSGYQVGRTFEGHSGAVTDMSFLPSSNCLVSCSLDGTVRIWDLSISGEGPSTPHGRLPMYFNGETRIVTSCLVVSSKQTFTPDGTYVVASSKDSPYLEILEASSGEKLEPTMVTDFKYIITDPAKSASTSWRRVSDLAFFPDGRCLVTVFADTVCLWDWHMVAPHRKYPHVPHISGVSPFKSIDGNFGNVQTVALTPHGDHMITGSLDCALRVFDVVQDSKGVHSVTLDAVLKGHKYPIMRVFISEDGLRIISVAYPPQSQVVYGTDTEIYVWEMRSRNCLKQVNHMDAWRLPQQLIMQLVGEASQETDAGLSILLLDREIKFGRGETKALLATMEAPIVSWALSPDNKTLCVGLANTHIGIMRIEIPGNSTE